MRAAALAFFFLSGLSGLIYEVVWIRTAGTVIGNTTYALGTVVGVYMAGLGLGAWRGGRAADRRTGARLLRLYGLLELGVAAGALAVPLLIKAGEPLFRLLWDTPLYPALRILLVAIVLLPPTALMGATLPVLSRYLADSAEAAPGAAGRAYAVNALGGVAGTLAAGFWLVPGFGLRASTVVAAAVNVAIAAAAILLARGRGGELRPAPPPPSPLPRLALAASALSGLTSLLYEVAWTRSLVLSLGSTVYAFTLILTAFILGLALGSAAGARLLPRISNPARALGFVQAAVGAAAILLLPFLGDLPLRLAPLIESLRGSYEKLLLAEFGLIALFVFLPTLAIGAVFPLACRLAAGPEEGVGRSVGAVYGWNTAGCIAGTLLASFALVPLLGLSATIVLAATINLALAAFLLRPRLAALPAAVAAAGWALHLASPWNPQVLASGVFLYSGDQAQGTAGFTTDLRVYLERDTELLARHWDSYGLVTVHRQQDGHVLMRVNGKTDASTGPSDRATMVFVGHVPSLHAPSPRRGLVIGLGGGLTLGALARHPFERIDCVEISPAVVRGAAFFKEANGNVLADPRLRLTIGDGRNALLFGRDAYDVIVSQPSNLWISGMAGLFTRDFFEEASRRLTPGGVFCQWVHAYKLDTENLKDVVRTFFSVFPHGSLWEIFPGHDYFLLGAREAARPSLAAIEARLRRTKALADYLEPGELLRHLVADAPGALAAAGPGPLITDDHCAIEYSAPRALYRDPRPATLAWLDGPRRRPAETALYGIEPAAAARIAEQREGRRVLAEAVRKAAEGGQLEAVRMLEDLRHRVGRDPRTQAFFDGLAKQLIQGAVRRLTQGNPRSAERLLRAVPPSSTRFAEAQVELGELYLWSRELGGDARRAFEAAAEAASPYHSAAARARLRELEGSFARAASEWEGAVKENPAHAPAWHQWAFALAKTGRRDEARAACRKALALDPAHEEAARLLEDLR